MPIDTTDKARKTVNVRWSHERGAVGRHVDSVVKRAAVLTNEERVRLATALVARTTAAQGLPEHVEDASALDVVATVMAGTP